MCGQRSFGAQHGSAHRVNSQGRTVPGTYLSVSVFRHTHAAVIVDDDSEDCKYSGESQSQSTYMAVRGTYRTGLRNTRRGPGRAADDVDPASCPWAQCVRCEDASGREKSVSASLSRRRDVIPPKEASVGRESRQVRTSAHSLHVSARHGCTLEAVRLPPYLLLTRLGLDLTAGNLDRWVSRELTRTYPMRAGKYAVLHRRVSVSLRPPDLLLRDVDKNELNDSSCIRTFEKSPLQAACSPALALPTADAARPPRTQAVMLTANRVGK